MTESAEIYGQHLAEFQKTAYVKGMDEYQKLHRQSIEDPEGFWAQQAEKYLSWEKKWDQVLDYDFTEARISWFSGGVLNASYNCLDRHMDTIADKIAYYWEGDNPEDTKAVTYKDLYTRVNRFAAVLKNNGVKKGDRVIIYMPMIVELPVSLLACARIGAIHSVVFGGFSADAIANRIKDCGAKVVITADGGYRGGKPVSLTIADESVIDKLVENRVDIENLK